MKYEEKHFQVTMGGKKYSDNWEDIFGKKEERDVDPAEEESGNPALRVPEALRPRPEDAISHDEPTALNFPKLTDLVGTDKKVTFVRYQDGELWYRCDEGFQFPVKIEECGTAAFMAQDKSMFFMRWIRKYRDFLTELTNENG